MVDKPIQRMKDLPSTHLLGTGTPMCAGCGGLAALHEICDVLGEKTVFVNAAGCMTLLSVYPFTPFRGSWLYTAMGSAPAGAQGVRDALDIRLARDNNHRAGSHQPGLRKLAENWPPSNRDRVHRDRL